MPISSAQEWTRWSAALRVCIALLTVVPILVGTREWTQGTEDRWVTLALRTIDAKAGRVSIDLSKAKGAFRAVRVVVRVGALTLTQVELKYGDGTIHRERRALALRQNQQTRLIGGRGEDTFLDRIVLSFRGVAGELDVATIAIEGLQSPSGAVAIRSPSPLSGPAATQSATPDRPDAAEKEANQPTEEQAEGAAREKRRTAREEQRRRSIAAEPPKAAPPAPAAPPVVQATPQLWDVVPVFYGTDRDRQEPSVSTVYGAERARRLELGRALVTVPKAHQVPNVERPWMVRLPFTQIVLHSEREDPNRHFTLKEVRPLTKEEFLRLVRERLGPSHIYKDHALVFVHGFNTSFEHALYRTAQIGYDLNFDGAPFLYSWPSKGALGDYSYDRESSGQAEPYLRQFIELVARETGATSVSVIAHSMGNQLLLPVLRDLKRMAPSGVAVSQVILAAPDVDRDAFENIVKELNGVSRGITLLAAGNDRALDIARRFWGGVPRAGDVPPGGPLVTEGIDTIDITAVSTEVFALNHSTYSEKIALLSDIQLLIQTGERPPDKRVPILERVKTVKGDYWRYPQLGR
jgi:esterase/lipase superfamily enzyme